MRTQLTEPISDVEGKEYLSGIKEEEAKRSPPRVKMQRHNLRGIVEDVLIAASDLGTFSTNQICQRSGHDSRVVKKVLSILSTKDRVRVGIRILPVGTRTYYQVRLLTLSDRIPRVQEVKKALGRE